MRWKEGTIKNFEVSSNKIPHIDLNTRNDQSLIDLRKLMDTDTLRYTNTISARSSSMEG